MLLYTVTWPATWLDRRGLPITSQAYQELLIERLGDIAKHGDPQCYQAYFPRYLLKTIQDWFAHHGEDLYQELKHVRNQLCDIEVLLCSQPSQSAEDVVTPIAQAHAVLAGQNRSRHASRVDQGRDCERKKRADNKQLNLL